MTMVDDARFERLVQTAMRLRGRSDAPDASRRAEVEAFLFAEARILDEQRYAEWIETFTDDGMYWVPINPEVGDPRDEVALACDDRRRLEDRVARLATGWAHSQIPRSRTVRSVTNVEVWTAGEDALDVRSNLVVHEYRRGRRQVLAGHQVHALVRRDDRLHVESRIVHLIDADFEVGNISFIV